MNNFIKFEIELTPIEANSLCTVLAQAIDYYTYNQDIETINPVWLWGLMHKLSGAVYEHYSKETEGTDDD